MSSAPPMPPDKETPKTEGLTSGPGDGQPAETPANSSGAKADTSSARARRGFEYLCTLKDQKKGPKKKVDSRKEVLNEELKKRRESARDTQTSQRRRDDEQDHDSEEYGEESWNRVPTTQEKAAQKAEKQAQKLGQLPKRYRLQEKYEAEFEATTAEKPLKSVGLLSIYSSIRAVVPTAEARLKEKSIPVVVQDPTKGSTKIYTAVVRLVVSVVDREELAKIQQVVNIAGVPVKAVSNEIPLWARVKDVNSQFTEEELLESWKEQGVVEVKRELYAAQAKDERGRSFKQMRESNRVRVRFDGSPRAELTLIGQRFPVFLCLDKPLQCLACHRFNHKIESCTRREKPLCRRCGGESHQIWECTKRASCVNCTGPHAANDPRCRVYAAWATSCSQRHVTRLVASQPDLAIEEETPEPCPPTETEDEAMEDTTGEVMQKLAPTQGGQSWAAVVGAPTMFKIVRQSGDSTTDVIYMPRLPQPKKPTKKTASTGKKQPTRSDSTVEMKEEKPAPEQTQKSKQKKTSSNGTPAPANGVNIVELLKAVWALAKPLVKKLCEKDKDVKEAFNTLENSPIVAVLVDMLVRSVQPAIQQ